MNTKIFSNLNYGKCADHIVCCDCRAEMLVPIGTEICPCCGANGCTRWANEDKKEVEISSYPNELEVCVAEFTQLYED